MASLSTIGSEDRASDLWNELRAEAETPGNRPSYDLAKKIFIAHPLGAKIAITPVEMALYRPRKIQMKSLKLQEISEQFEKTWKDLNFDEKVRNLGILSRVYGIGTAALILWEEEIDEETGKRTRKFFPMDKKIDRKTLGSARLTVNVWDTLNTAGQIILDQDPESPDYLQVPEYITLGSKTWKTAVTCYSLINEMGVFLDFEDSSFSFGPKSCYCRSIFPLYSYLCAQIANNNVAKKAGIIIAKVKQPGTFATKMQKDFQGHKADLLKTAENGDILVIDREDEIESINLMNIDASLQASRSNIIDDISAAASMPAQILKSETLAQGFGEGTEDSKTIARYLEGIRNWLTRPIERFFDPICRAVAWNDDFIDGMREKYPEQLGSLSNDAIFAAWEGDFEATWPDMLQAEPQEEAKAQKEKFELALACFQELNTALGGSEEARITLIKWFQNQINEAESLFAGELNIDEEDMEDAVNAPPEEKDQAENGPENIKQKIV